MDYFDPEGFDNLVEDECWVEMLARKENLRRDFQKNINLDYRLAIEDIRGSDQTIRRLIKVTDSIFHQLDSINFERVTKLIVQYGYPNMKEHGFYSDGIILVLMHATMYSEKTYQEVLAILKEAINDFSYTNSLLAQLMDRREVWHHERKQIYGTWNFYRGTKFEDIEEIKGIDEKRFKFNLLRLQEMSIIEKRVLPEGYQKGEYPKDYFRGYKMLD